MIFDNSPDLETAKSFSWLIKSSSDWSGTARDHLLEFESLEELDIDDVICWKLPLCLRSLKN